MELQDVLIPIACWVPAACSLSAAAWLVGRAVHDIRQGRWWGCLGLVSGLLGSALAEWVMDPSLSFLMRLS